MLYDRKLLSSFAKIIIAYSGGMDSHCLLHMLANDQLLKSKLQVVHINHGLSIHAKDWEKHCKAICDTLNISLRVITLDISSKPGKSLEATAREARYTALASIIDVNEVLLTAHHRDDQAETILIQLFRGAGVRGLAAMPKIKKFATGSHVRPLLEINHDDLKRYAEQHQLKWVEDESNQEYCFTRNYLRAEILPQLKKRWKNISTTITRSGQHCAEVNELLSELATLDLQSCQLENQALSITKLRKLSIARQINVLRYWLEQMSDRLPNTVTIQQIINTVILARGDRQPDLRWGNGLIRRFKHALYFVNDAAVSSNMDFNWHWSSHSFNINNMVISAIASVGVGLDRDKLPEVLTIKFRHGGEKIKPYRRKETHKLKHLLQEWQVPPWQRDKIPLVFADQQLIAVLGYCYHHDYVTTTNKKSIILQQTKKG